MSALSQSLSPALQRLGEVSVRLSVELGRTDMALRDVLALAEGSVVSLEKLTDELLDITANGQVIAHGEVIAQEGKFALRIVSLAGGDDGAGSGQSAPRRTTPTHAAPHDSGPNDAGPNHSGPNHSGTSGPRPDVPTPGDIPSPEAVANAAQPDVAAPAAEPEASSAPATPAASTDEPDAPPQQPADPQAETQSDPLLDALDELTDGDETPEAGDAP